jgi:hypothetical protein
VHAENVAVISKEGNDVEVRVAGLMPDREEDPECLSISQLPGCIHDSRTRSAAADWARRLAEPTGISVRRLLDILQGKTNRRHAILWKLLAVLDAFGRSVPAEDTDQHR